MIKWAILTIYTGQTSPIGQSQSICIYMIDLIKMDNAGLQFRRFPES